MDIQAEILRNENKMLHNKVELLKNQIDEWKKKYLLLFQDNDYPKGELEKIDEVKRPINIGEWFLVPHIEFNIGEPKTPIINLPHSDMESGQKYVHVHVDKRFIPEEFYLGHTTEASGLNRPIHYIPTKVQRLEIGNTPVERINTSKLPETCIHKGKCPHKGYDLSQERPINGIITCPLHGLKFDAETGELLTKNISKSDGTSFTMTEGGRR